VDTHPQAVVAAGSFDWHSDITALSANSSTITTYVCAIVAGTPTATRYNIYLKRMSGL
jgi:hypothetical protein